MSSETSSGLGAEFLDDFYTECDEHLTAIREALVALEGSVGKVQPDGPAVEKLFRSFHSFKGNSAIIGLRPAEELAHAAEDFLRELSRGQSSVTSEGLDLLMNVTQRLEQLVASHRGQKKLPDVKPLIEQLGHCSGKAGPEKPETTDPAPEPGAVSQPQINNAIELARARGLLIWRFRFSPNRDLDQRGINVNRVRERLSAVGEIFQATPLVRPDGVVFEFIAGLKQIPADITAWEQDGITSELFDSSSAPARQPQPGKRTPADSEEAQGSFVAPSHVVRVDLSRLDDLMRITGEMVIHRARLDDQVNRASARNGALDLRSLQEVNAALARALRELREGIMRVRLVSMSEIFARMPFVVRDLARETDKKVQLTFSGQETEIDKYVVERLKDPLLHLVRNSVSHGIEDPEERMAAGKPAQGTLFLRASTIGDSVLIEVGDDGRGIDAEAVRRRAAQLDLVCPPVMTNAGLLSLICSPGFSTRQEADRAAGRGVGMGVVQNTIRELGGTLSLESEPGKGTRFILRLPLTLAISDVLIVSAEAQTCAVPQSFVQEVMEMDSSQLRRINDAEILPYRNGVLPIMRLRSMFGFATAARKNDAVLVLSSEQGTTGLVVDRIHGQREVVMRALNDALVQVPGVAGATELGDGRPVLILDAMALTSGIVRPQSPDQLREVQARSTAVTI